MDELQFGMEENLSWINESLDRLRHIDPKFHLDCYVSVHQYKLNPTLTEEEIQAFEIEYGLNLPADYRSFVKFVGNGGAGPNFGIQMLRQSITESDLSIPFPLTKEQASEIDQNPLHDWEFNTGLIPGVLCLSTKTYAWPVYLILKGKAYGTVWTTNPSGDYSQLASTFLEFYKNWLRYCFEKLSRYQRFLKVIEDWRLKNESTWKALWE
jgi:SMI1 / KNR4 family (SUKH-1)